MSATMDSLFAVIISAAVVDNIVLTKMLGLCPFISLSRRLGTAVAVGFATTLVLTITAAVAFVFNRFLADAPALRPLVFIAAVAVVVQAMELASRRYAPLWHRRLGIFLPLIATNCAVLGIILLSLRGYADSFFAAVAFALGGGLGFLIAVVGAALIRARLVDSQTPAALRGAPLSLISAGFMALAFSALA